REREGERCRRTGGGERPGGRPVVELLVVQDQVVRVRGERVQARDGGLRPPVGVDLPHRAQRLTDTNLHGVGVQRLHRDGETVVRGRTHVRVLHRRYRSGG